LPKPRWTDVVKAGLNDLLAHDQLSYMQDTLWNIAPHPVEAAASLPIPKPDIAVGYLRLDSMDRDLGNASVWSRAYMEALRDSPQLYFDGSVTGGMPELLFPFFVFEIKSIVGTTFSAANQLSNSLSYALGVIRKLRQDATSGTARQRLHLFGAVSSGTTWQIYIAYEADPTQPNLECNLVKVWAGDIAFPQQALQFFLLVRRIKEWAFATLQPTLTEWLESLRTIIVRPPTPMQISEGEHAGGSSG